ncbi:MAG: murein hydrolase activator EnvC family protein [Kiloniellaceae bacterium]
MTAHPQSRALQRRTRNRRLAGGLCLALVLGTGGMAAPLKAQQADLEQLERDLAADRARAETLKAAADELAGEVEALRARSIAAAKRAQDLEAEMTAVEQTLKALNAEEAAKSANLAQRRDQLGRTLGALQRLALQPPEAALARSEQPIDSARAALLLRVAIPELEAQATNLRDELGDLAVLRTRIALERDDLAAATASLGSERDRLGGLLARKAELQASTDAERKAAAARVAKLAGEAQDLRDLTERLESERREAERLAAAQRAAEEARQEAARAEAARQEAARQSTARETQAEAEATSRQVEQEVRQIARLTPPPSLRPFPEAESSLIMPVRGQVVRLYGQESTAAGSTDKGISIQTRPEAQVVAPFDGKIAYAGQFRGYGLILIIDHGGRYHTILAGFDRIDAVVGQWVLAGEPVARMGGPAGGNPELYLELRRTGQAINPLPWLATTDDKVRG